MEIKPFTPSEAKKHHAEGLPNEVISAINELLAENYSAGRASIRIEKEVMIARIQGKMEGLSRERIIANNWLEIEAAYESFGWKVSYDNPSIGDTWVASFVFTPHQA
jgi:hypothetical protein